MNELQTDYPCNLKLWHMYILHYYLSIYAKKILAKKIECNFKQHKVSILSGIGVPLCCHGNEL